MVQLVIAVRVVRVVRLFKVIGVVRVIRVIEEAKAVEGERRAQGEHLGTPRGSTRDPEKVPGGQRGHLWGRRDSMGKPTGSKGVRERPRRQRGRKGKRIYTYKWSGGVRLDDVNSVNRLYTHQIENSVWRTD